MERRLPWNTSAASNVIIGESNCEVELNGDAKTVIEVIDASHQTVGRVEQTVDQEAGGPAQVMAEVPIHVSAAGPGRVLV